MEYLFQVFTLVNPIAIYAVSNFFNNDMKASIFIRIYYFAFGGLAPISVIVLKIITKETAKWGVWLDRIFKFCPVYNLDYGYLAINNRKVLTLTSKLPDKNKLALTIDAYHEIIAGGNIENLEYTFYVCLAIFLLVEGGLIDFASRPFLRLFRRFNHFTD